MLGNQEDSSPRLMAIEIRMIRWMRGITRLDRIRNKVIRDKVRVTRGRVDLDGLGICSGGLRMQL